MSKVLYESDFALLTFFKDKRILELKWKKASSFEEYKKVFSNAVEIAENNKIDFFLSDIKNEGAISIENLFWLKKNIIPKAENLGVSKIALILKPDIFSGIYAESIRKRLEKSKIAFNFFEVYEEAIAWFGS